MKGNYLGDKMPVLPWMINFDCPIKKCFKQDDSAKADNTLEYHANLSLNTVCANYLLTGISCTLGVNNADPNFIERLLKENITFAVIDLSQGSEYEQSTLLNTIRDSVQFYSDECGRVYPFTIAVELSGLRIRTGNLDTKKLEDIILDENHTVYITTNDNYDCHCNKNVIYINYREILKFLTPTNLIYIDYGTIILEVSDIGRRPDRIKCRVINGGRLRDQAIIHIPNIPLSLENEIKVETLTFALRNELDAVVISRVRDPQIVDSIRDILGDEGKGIMIISKIEDSIGVENADDIIETSDAIIIARSELGMEIPPEKLFIAQKSITAKCNKAGKPVICTGQFLKTMYKNLLPTRAEMLDASNAVLDGVDGILLTEELVNSLNLTHALRALQNICIEAEAAMFQKQVISNLLDVMPSTLEPTYSIAISAVDASIKCDAACIIVLTVSGRSAKLIAQYKPRCPIIAVTRYARVARLLNLWRGIVPMLYTANPREEYAKELESRFQYAITYGKFSSLIKAGDVCVLVSGWKEFAGFTNTIRIVYASENDCKWVNSKPCPKNS